MAKRKNKSRPRRKVPASRKHGASQSPRAGRRAGAIETALAGIAHDIRTPLTGMVALAELLAASDLGERQREWAAAIKSGAEHLAALSTLIVDAVKANATGLVLRREPFQPRVLAQTVGHALAARAANRDIDVDIAIDSKLPPMAAGDAMRLRAALENLADNAVKFTDSGRIAFSADVEAAAHNPVRLVFTLADSGIGMSAAELKRLFRPFSQANPRIAERYGGAGLGLVFVKRIAQAMGGDLEVTSEPGRGSTFRFTALVEKVEEAPAETASGAPAVPTRKLSVLCAEDNPYGRVVMNTILTQLGHAADFVESGEAAVNAVAAGRYDAVLMDITLAGVDGLEATRRIRTLPGMAGAVPIIGISGHGDAADERSARGVGVDFYFVKPVSPAKLAQVLNAIASRARETGLPP